MSFGAPPQRWIAFQRSRPSTENTNSKATFYFPQEAAAIVGMLDRPEWMFAGSLAELLPGNVTLDEHHDMLLFPGVVVGRYLCGVRDLVEWTAGIAVHAHGHICAVESEIDVHSFRESVQRLGRVR